MDLMHTTQIAFAFGSTLLLVPLLNRVAIGLGWVDAPSERKAHEGIVPLTGGLAIASAVAITAVLTNLQWPDYTYGLFAGLLLCFFTGLWDDRFPIRARYRLFAQIAAALAAVIGGGTVLESLSQTFGPHVLGLWIFAVPMTIVGLTGVVNAYNMSDGLDGLCSGYVLIALIAFLSCAALIQAEDPSQAALSELAPVILPFVGAILAFLLFNLRHPWRAKAASFLGDGGSMSLGFLLAWLAVRLTGSFGNSGIPPVTAVLIVAIPLADMFSCMARRVNEGVTPMTADARHLHHLLLKRGFSVRQTVARLHLISAGLAATGIGAWQFGVPQYTVFWTLMLAFTAYTWSALRFWRRLPPTPGSSDLIGPGPGDSPSAKHTNGKLVAER